MFISYRIPWEDTQINSSDKDTILKMVYHIMDCSGSREIKRVLFVKKRPNEMTFGYSLVFKLDLDLDYMVSPKLNYDKIVEDLGEQWASIAEAFGIF